MSKALAIAAFAAVLIVTATANADVDATVRLKESAKSSGPVVKLADVAVITDPAGRVAGETPLGAAPKPGTTSKITLDDVKMRLDLAGVDIERIRFTGAKETTVTRAGAAKTGNNNNEARLTELAHKALKRILAQKGVTADFEVLSVGMRHLLEPDGSLKLAADPAPSKGSVLNRSGLVTIYVTVLEHDGYTSSVPVQFRLTVMRKVAVAARPIPKGKLITPEMVRIEKRPDDEPGLALKDVLGKKARLKVEKGACLVAVMLEEPPLVSRGRLVRVVVRSDGLQITTMGRAKMDGSRGQEIEVENTKTKKAFLARVTGPAEVTVGRTADGNAEKTTLTADTGSRHK
jgi:flagella basal body P-ring formation protein FlgA